MDNITHSLVGALIGQAGLKRRTGLAMPALIIGANLPDVDVVTVLLGDMQHLALRRGITHGPIAWVLLPLLLAGALWWFDRWQGRRGTRPEGRLPVRFGWLYALSFIACLTHPALDWLNVYGVRLLEPFSSRWFYGDVLFIVDVWLWLGMGFATWHSLRREGREHDWRTPAQVGLALVLAYITLNGAISFVRHQLITGLYEPFPSKAIAAPVPFAFWRREAIILAHDGRWFSTDWKGTQDGHGHGSSRYEQCAMPGLHYQDRGDVRAFHFWSRAPFAERAPNGSVILRDARYYDPRARDRFSVALPGVRCESLAPLP